MSKLLLVIIAALLVYWVLRSYRKGLLKPQQHRDAAGEDMVRCMHCGVNLPKSESFTIQGDFFCSQEHQRAYLNKK
ncbi:MAG: PP0621 family protein [Burkholderiales bacterium]